MLSLEEPPAAAPLLASGEVLPCAPPPPPLEPPVLGTGIPTLGKPPGIGTPTVTFGPDEPELCPDCPPEFDPPL